MTAKNCRRKRTESDGETSLGVVFPASVGMTQSAGSTATTGEVWGHPVRRSLTLWRVAWGEPMPPVVGTWPVRRATSRAIVGGARDAIDDVGNANGCELHIIDTVEHRECAACTRPFPKATKTQVMI